MLIRLDPSVHDAVSRWTQDALLSGKRGGCAVHLSKAMHAGTMT